MHEKVENARASAVQKGEEYSKTFYAAVARDIRRWRLEPAEHDFLQTATHGRLEDRQLHCNRYARTAAQRALIDAFLDEYEAYPQRQRLWITFALDQFLTRERQPEIDLIAMRNIVQHYLRREGVDGVGAIEWDVWKHIVGEQGRRFVGQVHFYGWSRSGLPLDAKALETRLCKKRKLRNSLGARPVVVRAVGGRAADAAYLGMYMLKAPFAAKNLVQGVNRNYLRSVRFPLGSAARIVEVLSHIEVGDVLFAIGDGKRINKHVHGAINIASRSKPSGPAPSRHQVIQLWRDIRICNGNKLLAEPTVITRIAHRNEKTPTGTYGYAGERASNPTIRL